jgi:hypothetical protein
MVAAQRAWVGPFDAHLDGKLAVGGDIDVMVNYVNTGREPALSFNYTTDQFVATVKEGVSDEGTKRVGDNLQKCLATDPVAATAATQVVYPTLSGSGFGQLRATIHGLDVDGDVLSGTKTILVPGCFTYRTFGQIRHSAFCFFFQATKTKPEHLAYCGFGSYAD